MRDLRKRGSRKERRPDRKEAQRMSTVVMKSLEQYPDLMTKEEVAEVLRCRPSMVNRLVGLRKTRIGNGRGKVLYRKQDVIEYINSKVEREEAIKVADQQKERYRKMGVSPLVSWEELQKARLGHAGGGG